MEFEKNTLLFGADQTPRIVAVELGESGTVRVHRRETDGSTVTEVEPFHPFVWADSDVVDLGIETEKLRGDLKYGWLITVDSWKELIALRNGLKNAGRAFFAFTGPRAALPHRDGTHVVQGFAVRGAETHATRSARCSRRR